MSDLNTVATIAQIVSVVSPALFGVYAIWRRIDKRQTESHIDTLRMSDKLDYIEQQFKVQFGGNGGGMREAINNIATKQDKIEGRVDTIAEDMANLRGKFDQHIKEGS
jgi:archaellum component FlaC